VSPSSSEVVVDSAETFSALVADAYGNVIEAPDVR
jgi:hypothetical protein